MPSPQRKSDPTHEEMGLFVLFYTDMGEGKGVGFVRSRPATTADIEKWLNDNGKSEVNQEATDGLRNME